MQRQDENEKCRPLYTVFPELFLTFHRHRFVLHEVVCNWQAILNSTDSTNLNYDVVYQNSLR